VVESRHEAEEVASVYVDRGGYARGLFANDTVMKGVYRGMHWWNEDVVDVESDGEKSVSKRN
jgi:hypothetical protein